jgi:tetratricopeptide (TPR) repeat protein
VRPGSRVRSARVPEYINDTGGAIRISFEDEPPKPRTTLAAMKARLLRPGFLIALSVAVVAAAASLLTGYPATRGGAAGLASPAPGRVSDGRAVTAAPPARAGRGAATSEEARFLDDDDAGRIAYRDGNLEEALARFNTAVARNPSDAESMSNAAQILVRLGRLDEATALLQQAVHLNPDRWAYRFNLARAFDQAWQLDRAVEQYEAAAALFPDDYATLFNLARTYHRQGNEVAAIDRYGRAIALNPQEPSFHFAMAISLEQLGRRADAAESYARFLELAPESPDAARVRTRITALQAVEGNAGTAPSTPAPTEKTSAK